MAAAKVVAVVMGAPTAAMAVAAAVSMEPVAAAVGTEGRLEQKRLPPSCSDCSAFAPSLQVHALASAEPYTVCHPAYYPRAYPPFTFFGGCFLGASGPSSPSLLGGGALGGSSVPTYSTAVIPYLYPPFSNIHQRDIIYANQLFLHPPGALAGATSSGEHTQQDHICHVARACHLPRNLYSCNARF